MNIFRRRPPDKYHPLKDDSWFPHNNDPRLLPQQATSDEQSGDEKKRRKQKNLSFMNENQLVGEKMEKRELNVLCRDLLRSWSNTRLKLDLKRNHEISSNPSYDTHDLDGDTATAGSSSAGGYHSLLVTSYKSSVTSNRKKKEETRNIPTIRPRQLSKFAPRNEIARTDMAGICVVPRDRRGPSHRALRKRRSPQPSPHRTLEPRGQDHLAPADEKEMWVSTSPQSLPYHARGQEKQIRPKANPSPAHAKDSFASFMKSRSQSSHSRIGVELEEVGDLPSLSKERNLGGDNSCDSAVPALEESTSQNGDKRKEEGAVDLPPFTVPVRTKRILRMEEHNDVDVGDLPALTIPVWIKRKLKLCSRTEENSGTDITCSSSDLDEEHPFDELAGMVPSVTSSDLSEDDPFDCSNSVSNDRFPFDEPDEMTPSLLTAKLQDQHPQEDQPFDCCFNLEAPCDEPVEMISSRSTDGNGHLNLDTTEYPFDETEELTPSLSNDLPDRQLQEHCKDCSIDSRLTLDAAKCPFDENPEMVLSSNDLQNSSCNLDDTKRYPFGETADMVLSVSTENNLQDQQQLQQEAVPEPNPPPEMVLVDPCSLDNDTLSFNATSIQDDLSIPKDDIDDDSNGLETSSQDPEQRAISQLEDGIKEESSNCNEDDNDPEEEDHAKEEYPMDEKEDAMAKEEEQEKESILDSALKFFGAFAPNLDGYEYETRYISKTYGI